MNIEHVPSIHPSIHRLNAFSFFSLFFSFLIAPILFLLSSLVHSWIHVCLWARVRDGSMFWYAKCQPKFSKRSMGPRIRNNEIGSQFTIFALKCMRICWISFRIAYCSFIGICWYGMELLDAAADNTIICAWIQGWILLLLLFHRLNDNGMLSRMRSRVWSEIKQTTWGNSTHHPVLLRSVIFPRVICLTSNREMTAITSMSSELPLNELPSATNN